MWEKIRSFFGLYPSVSKEIQERTCFTDELPNGRFKLTFTSMEEYLHYLEEVFHEMLSVYDTIDAEEEEECSYVETSAKSMTSPSLRDAYLKSPDSVPSQSQLLKSIGSITSLFVSDGEYKHQSMGKSTIKPDGTIETQQTIKHSDGVVETIVSKICGNKEYITTKRKGKDGKEVVTQSVVDLDNEVLSLE